MSRNLAAAIALVVPWALAGAQEPALPATGLPADLPRPLHEAFFDAQCRNDPDAYRATDQKVARQPPRAQKPLPQPEYPVSARRAGKQGTTSMLLLVNEEGRVVKAVVERSSGHRELDQAALDGARRWQFTAPTLDAKPHCAWGRFAMTFKTFEGAGDTEPLIRPEAQPLVSLLLSTDRLKTALARAPLLRGEPTAGEVIQETQANVIVPESYMDLSREYAALLSSNLSGEELAAITAFYQTPAGARWMKVQPGIDRAVGEKLNVQLGAAACRIFLVQRAAAQTPPAAAGTQADSPESTRVRLRAAMPKIIQANQTYCGCAGTQFLRSLLLADDTSRGRLVDDVRKATTCGVPEQVQW